MSARYILLMIMRAHIRLQLASSFQLRLSLGLLKLLVLHMLQLLLSLADSFVLDNELMMPDNALSLPIYMKGITRTPLMRHARIGDFLSLLGSNLLIRTNISRRVC